MKKNDDLILVPRGDLLAFIDTLSGIGRKDWDAALRVEEIARSGPAHNPATTDAPTKTGREFHRENMIPCPRCDDGVLTYDEGEPTTRSHPGEPLVIGCIDCGWEMSDDAVQALLGEKWKREHEEAYEFECQAT